MPTHPQRRAVDEFRLRQARAGIGRFEVAAPHRDKELIRRVAKALTGAEAEATRAGLAHLLESATDEQRGGVWRALRASPLVGAGLDLARREDGGRDVDL